MCLSGGGGAGRIPSHTTGLGGSSRPRPPPCRAEEEAARRGGKSLPRKGIPAAATVPLRLSWLPPCWQRAFSSEWGREGFGGGSRQEQGGPTALGSPSGTNRPPPLPSLPKPRRAPGADPQSGPRPSAPFPLFPRISGGGLGSACGRTFFAKKGKDAAARATGTSGSDSRHEWVMAPPPRDSRAGAGMSEGGYPPKWGDGAERCSPLPASDAPDPALSAACGLGSAVQAVGARLVRTGCGAG